MLDAVPAPLWKTDLARWPLVLLYVADADGVTAPDIDSMLRELDALSARKERKVVIVDLTFAKPDAARRKRFVDWAKSRWASVRTDLVAVAAIAPGAFQRSLITGVLWFVEAPCPTAVFERKADAMLWAEERVREAGLRK